jgi:3D (Asp-Asp-Asp) domain-containing protein
MGISLQAKGVSSIPIKPVPVPPVKPAVKAGTRLATDSTSSSVSTPKVCVKEIPSSKGGFSSFIATEKTSVSSESTTGLMKGRLARLTAYWASEGDYYTRHCVSATGIRLHGGHCAVDPRIIPYGSVVEIPGVGKYLAVDTGSAVISREAAREAAHNLEERSALVIDLFFESRRDGEEFAANGPKYVAISWWSPSSSAALAKEARSLFADENWSKIQSKQL